jgi:hypothetical protein
MYSSPVLIRRLALYRMLCRRTPWRRAALTEPHTPRARHAFNGDGFIGPCPRLTRPSRIRSGPQLRPGPSLRLSRGLTPIHGGWGARLTRSGPARHFMALRRRARPCRLNGSARLSEYTAPSAAWNGRGDRLGSERAARPQMAWTGPGRSPGPGRIAWARPPGPGRPGREHAPCGLGGCAGLGRARCPSESAGGRVQVEGRPAGPGHGGRAGPQQRAIGLTAEPARGGFQVDDGPARRLL